MRSTAACSIVVGFACLLGGAAESEVPWDKQFAEMGYHILYTSSINLINGLQLTQEQATRLRQLAAEAEKASQKPPVNSGTFGAKLQQVRSAYLEVEELLLKGEEVPKDVEARMAGARMVEAAVIHASLSRDPSKQGCGKCHSDPATRGPSAKLEDRNSFNPFELGAAHAIGPFGDLFGFLKAMAKGKDIEQILTPAQLAVVGDFSCCITPPKNLKDPARVGQASVSEEKLNLLRGARKVPESLWPVTRAILLIKAQDVFAAISPGMPESEKITHTAKAGEILDKARALSDVDFELQKEELAKSWDPGGNNKPRAVNPVKAEHQAATFLMLPGATRAYDALLTRLKNSQTATTAQVDLNTIQGADNCKDGHCALKNGGNIKPGEK
ncbi:MAG: hypothetical protein ABSE73_06350 [Planctomycetota bacterium]